MEVIVMSPLDVKNLVQVAINEILHSKGIEIYGKGKTTPQPEQDELLSRAETMQYLKITGATLWRYEKQGKIQSIGIGGKRYFRKSEIEASLILKK